MAEIHLNFPSGKNREPFEEVRGFLLDLAEIALDAIVTSVIQYVLNEILVDALGGKSLRKGYFDGGKLGAGNRHRAVNRCIRKRPVPDRRALVDHFALLPLKSRRELVAYFGRCPGILQR